jgi:hypothetical protein
VRVGDLALCAHDSLAHRRLRDEKSARDLAGGEPTEGAQRQRHARAHVKRGMAAREDQAQAIVDDRAVVRHGRLSLGLEAQQFPEALGALAAGAAATEAIDRSAPGGDRQPRARTRRHTVARPADDRRGERVLDGFFGEVEVTHMADQRGQHRGALVAERPLDRAAGAGLRWAHSWVGRSFVGITGRTSTLP